MPIPQTIRIKRHVPSLSLDKVVLSNMAFIISIKPFAKYVQNYIRVTEMKSGQLENINPIPNMVL